MQWRFKRCFVALYYIMNRVSVSYKFQEAFFEFYAYNKEFRQLVSNICSISSLRDIYLFIYFLCVYIYIYFLNYLFIYLFLAVLGLRFCARAFSSCGKRGPRFIAVRGPLTISASLVAEHRLQTRRLSSCGSRA